MTTMDRVLLTGTFLLLADPPLVAAVLFGVLAMCWPYIEAALRAKTRRERQVPDER